MAYVLWRVLMKKYTKVRLGIRNLSVIPAERQGPERDETWTLALENQELDAEEEKRRRSSEVTAASESSEYEPNLPRSHETRKSKTKRVKNYLRKKCKDALARGDDASAERRTTKGTSWYIDQKAILETERTGEIAAERAETDDDDEEPRDLKIGSRCSLYEDAKDSTVVEKLPDEATPSADSLETLVVVDWANVDKFKSSDTLVAKLAVQNPTTTLTTDESVCLDTAAKEVFEDEPHVPKLLSVHVARRLDVATLVRHLLGPLYGDGVLDLLIRQARDVLVCAYHGNIEDFLASFLAPASELLAEAKMTAIENGNEAVVPKGWPLTLGEVGLVVNLGELEASALRVGECYLCVRKPSSTGVCIAKPRRSSGGNESVEIALVWRTSMRAPVILGWDREDEYMDWRECRAPFSSPPPPPPSSSSSASSASSTSTSTSSREGVRWSRIPRTEEDGGPRRSKPRGLEDRSSSVRAASAEADRETSSEAPVATLSKSRSTSSVESWPENATSRSERRRRSRNSSLNREPRDTRSDGMARIKRGTVVSQSSVENWKGSSRSEQKSRALGSNEIRNPFALKRATGCAEYDEEEEEEEEAAAAATRVRGSRQPPRRNLLPEAVSDEDLPGYIGTLLVGVERAVERVTLDDLPFPCPSCGHADLGDPIFGCKCALEACACLATTCECPRERREVLVPWRASEIAGIKHIDSDDEEEVRMGFGDKKNREELKTPRSIHDLADCSLVCGLTLPGYRDNDQRSVLVYDASVDLPALVSPVEIANLILYLANLPRTDRVDLEFTLLVIGEPSEKLDLLDNALHLLQNSVKIDKALIVRASSDDAPCKPFLPRSQIKAVTVDENTLANYIVRPKEQHDQTRWIDFFKEYDTTMHEWQGAGRRLASAMSDLEECSIISRPIAPLTRLLTDATGKRSTADGQEVLAVLEERASCLLHVEQVRLSLERARRLIAEVGNAATRLEVSCEARRATVRNLTVLRSIEDQARELLAWLCNKGQETLSRHSRATPTTLRAARIDEREFEKFYFTSMKHLDKGSDLAEAANTSGLRELARSLKQHLRGFGSRLEDTRERLEDTSRCFLLLDRAYEWALEATRVVGDRRTQQFLMARPPLPREHFAEMIALAEKLGNEPLLEQCRVARNRCAEALELARSVSTPGSPARRRSFGANGSATSWDDGLAKRTGTSWDDSDSASCICPVDGVAVANGSGAGTGSVGRPILDNIAELRESAEQLLDCSPPRSPPRSPAPRRLTKPPVNSHLQRAPSIAPGMKAKKTILLIMREMIQTERDYVKSLEYIIENYIPELVREDIPQALRGQRNVIFGNVEKIYEFHSQHFLRELEQCEQCPMLVGQCFVRHEKKFYLYALYNKNKPNSDSLMAEYGTAFFKAKQLELGDKMDLASYLLKPVQRMGKYALLLQQLVKAGTDLCDQLASKDDKDDGKEEDKEEESKPWVEGEADLRAAEQMVRFQLRHGNDLLAMDSLRDCDVNVKEQGRLLRQNEFLVWQGKGKKCLRQVFLFEDLILFSKARRFPDRKNLDIYIYKNSIKTTDIGLTAVIADSPTKFEIWFRKRKPGDTYTLQCANEDIKKTWAEELSNLLWKQALRNREVRLAEMSSMGIGNKPCLDIRPSADQINDRSISVAQLSKTPRFRNSIAVSISEDSARCSRRPHSVISVSSSSSSGGSSGPAATLHLGLDASPRPHHRSTTLNSQCSVESGIIADISIVSDDGGDGTERNHWNSSLESPTSHLPTTSTPLQSPTSVSTMGMPSAAESNLAPYDQEMSINL